MTESRKGQIVEIFGFKGQILKGRINMNECIKGRIIIGRIAEGRILKKPKVGKLKLLKNLGLMA